MTPAEACRRKKSYSRANVIRAVSRVRDLARDDVTAYRCPVCGRWHLTKRREGQPIGAKKG